MNDRRLLAGLALFGLLVSPLLPTPAVAQSLEGVRRPEGEARPTGYLAPGTLDYRLLVGPPPERDSLIDRLDMQVSNGFQMAIAPDRWEIAQADNATVYPRFAEAFGKPIDRQTSPALIRLLNRVTRDAADPVWRAKDAFQRPRPYQRYQLTRRCGSSPVPAPDPQPRGGSSYPSGHSVYGWATALILAQVAPARAPQLLERGRDYGLSRVICGYHFPTDVEAARAVATAVVDRLRDVPEFQADLRAAQAEYGPESAPAPVPAPAAGQARSGVEAQAD